MPFANTNSFKKYIRWYESIKMEFDDPCRLKSDDESRNEYLQKCDGRYGMEYEIEVIQKKLMIAIYLFMTWKILLEMSR